MDPSFKNSYLNGYIYNIDLAKYFLWQLRNCPTGLEANVVYRINSVIISLCYMEAFAKLVFCHGSFLMLGKGEDTVRCKESLLQRSWGKANLLLCIALAIRRPSLSFPDLNIALRQKDHLRENLFDSKVLDLEPLVRRTVADVHLICSRGGRAFFRNICQQIIL